MKLKVNRLTLSETYEQFKESLRVGGSLLLYFRQNIEMKQDFRF